VFGEVFEAFRQFVAKPSFQRERGVAERGEDIRRMPDMSGRVIFAACYIEGAMKGGSRSPSAPAKAQAIGRDQPAPR